MNNWFGPIQVDKISNTFPAGMNVPGGQDFVPLDATHLKVVHYPDCQQLIIWLPRPGREYGQFRLQEMETDTVVEEWPVSGKLSGAIQLLWDTLPVKPGSYRIGIGWKEGYQHTIDFTKYKEGEGMPLPIAEENKPGEKSGPIVYKDGFGKLIENEDLLLREKVMKEIQARFSRTLAYSSEGRSGTVIYVEGDTRIHFYYELGGGNCVAFIDIPTKEQWEAATQTSLDRRDDIIDFVAHRARDQQASGCNIEIRDGSISFLKK